MVYVTGGDVIGEQLRAALAGGRGTLDEIESKRLLRTAAGIPASDPVVAGSAADAVAAAERLGYPVALKIISAQVLHKSDVGGVALGLADADGVRRAFETIVHGVGRHVPGAEVSGVAVEPMAPPGLEMIVGLQRDPTFGPTVVVGLGGTLVELLGDVAMRVVPFDRGDAEEMIDEIKGGRLLRGYRDHPPRDVAALVEVIFAMHKLAAVPEIESVDLNPVIVYGAGQGALVVDASVVLRAAPDSEGGARCE